MTQILRVAVAALAVGFPTSPARTGTPLVTDPARIDVPPYDPDTPIVREELARMYDNVADMDAQVGQILAQVAGATFAPLDSPLRGSGFHGLSARRTTRSRPSVIH